MAVLPACKCVSACITQSNGRWHAGQLQTAMNAARCDARPSCLQRTRALLDDSMHPASRARSRGDAPASRPAAQPWTLAGRVRPACTLALHASPACGSRRTANKRIASIGGHALQPIIMGGGGGGRSVAPPNGSNFPLIPHALPFFARGRSPLRVPRTPKCLRRQGTDPLTSSPFLFRPLYILGGFFDVF